MANSFLDKTGLTYLWGKITALVATKQDTLTFDTTPTASSTNPVTSGGIKTALDGKAASDHTQTVAKGGTNIGSYTKGDMIYATAGTTLAKLAIGTAGNFLKATADGPSWAALPTASSSTAGVTTVGASGGAAAYSHTHSGYVDKTGDTMTGVLVANNFVSKYGVEFQNSSGTNVGGIFQDMAGANQFYMDEYTTNGVRECYLLPTPTATSTSFYDILTSKSAVTVAQGGTGATDAATARTNLGLGTMSTESASDYLPLSGGTMTGAITLHTTGFYTANEAGYAVNQYGNFTHTRTNANDTWGVVGANGEAFKVAFDTGKTQILSTQGSAAGTTFSDSVLLQQTSATIANNGFVYGTAFYAPNMAAGSHAIGIIVGQACSAGNCGYMSFKYAGNNNSGNYVALGLHSTDEALKVWKSGDVESTANAYVDGGNVYIKKSDYPYVHLCNASNQEIGGIWAHLSNKRVYIRVRPSAGSSYATDFVFPAANATANATKYVYTSDNFSLSGTTLTITPPS